MAQEGKRELRAGAILTLLGLVFLAVRLSSTAGRYLLTAIGVAFLMAYLWTRDDDLLVPGAILTGLGLGIALQPEGWEEGTFVLLGLGLGLLGLYVLGHLVARHPPAPSASLVPGTALLLLGLLEAFATGGLLRIIARWWPVAPLAAGVFILWRDRRK
jgi:hypothetical protein